MRSYLIFRLSRHLLRGIHRVKTRWNRLRDTVRNTRRLARILRDEPPHVARIVDLFFCERLPVEMIAARLDLMPDDVWRDLSRIIAHFEAGD